MALSGFTRILGISLLLLAICVVTTYLNPVFVDPLNLSNLLGWTALFGILGMGVAFVIITGGIDLSIGSVVALSGICLMIFLQVSYYDSGHTLKVESIDPDTKTITFEAPVPSHSDLDRLVIPSQATADDITLVIDLAKTRAVGDDKTLVLRSNVRRVEVGSVATLEYQSRLMHPLVAVLLTLLIGAGIGLFHGLLIGYMRLQSFVVTLCGLMAYRGLARLVSGDESVGVGSHHESLRYLAKGKPIEIPVPLINKISATGDEAAQASQGLWGWVELPMPMLILLVIAVLSAVLLHKTVAGRYLLAMGRNAEAARFSGINTKQMTVLAYVICSTLAALGGALFALNIGSVTPASDGNFYELYAIAAAVLGGCSLRGGVGSIAGVIIGTAVMRSLYNAINLLKQPTYWEFIIIGVVLLLGVMIDEIGRQVVSRYKTRRRKKMLAG